MDYVKSGVGGESTDQSFSATNVKPLWHLKPLPLTQVNPSTRRSRLRQSLASLCLTKVSENFHLYEPSTLATLPPTLIERVLLRINGDRGYQTDSCEDTNHRPDLTTIWAYSAISGQADGPDHTLGLPMSTTLLHLRPDETLAEPFHPFQSIPAIYRQLDPPPPLAFLTSLSLDAVDNVVNDQSILNLKWCTNLTVLWTRGCSITDHAIRLLASSLDLPSSKDKGMCRLRAWYLPGCKAVTDRSMKSFARWPGLVLLDVRDTSCTTVAIDIFNQSSRSYFACQNADFQPCTDGLKTLFSAKARPAETLEALCQTLIQRPAGLAGTQDRWWLGLHLVPSHAPIPANQLPYTAAAKPSFTPRSRTSVYRSGIGQVYGTHVSSITDEAVHFRQNLKTAMRIQAEDEGLCAPEMPPWMEDKLWGRKGRGKGSRGGFTGIGRNGWDSWTPQKVLKGYKYSAAELADCRSKGFATNGRRKPKPAVEKKIDGDTECMMVRMVGDHWESLEWATARSEMTTTQAQITASQRVGRAADDLISDIFGTVSRRTLAYSSQEAPPDLDADVDVKPDPSNIDIKPDLSLKDVKPDVKPDIKPDIKPVIRSSPSNPFATKKANPFRQTAKPATTSMGVRPLKASQSEGEWKPKPEDRLGGAAKPSLAGSTDSMGTKKIPFTSKRRLTEGLHHSQGVTMSHSVKHEEQPDFKLEKFSQPQRAMTVTPPGKKRARDGEQAAGQRKISSIFAKKSI